MAKLTLEEKKMEKIRMQLFGKEQTPKKNLQHNLKVPDDKKTNSVSTTSMHTAESIFFRQDLVKVFLFSMILIGGQFLLYFLSIKKIIQLDIFHIFN